MDKEFDLWKTFGDNKEVIELVNKINEADKKINYNEKRGINTWELQYKESIEKIKKRHPDLGLEAEKLYKKYNRDVQKQYKKVKIGVAIPIISSIVGFIAANVYTTKLQVESSRVARWQARKVLEDPKYFVNYTPEQIEEAKKIIENDPEYKKKDKKLKTDKLKSGLFKGLGSVIRDNRAYRKWKKTDVDESKKVDRPLTAQELEQAKKDKEIIQRVVRTINNQAEIYSQNMEVAANVIMSTTPFLGAAAGAVVSSVMNWTKAIPKYIAKQVEKFGSDEAKKAYENMKAHKEGSREFKSARKKFLKEFFYEPYLPMEKQQKRPSKMQIIEKNVKKSVAATMTTKWGRRGVFGLIGGFVSAIGGSLIALKLQKASSRTGRYIAKRELEENPKNFIGYTDEEMQEVKDIKAPKKTFGEKVKGYALFIPNVMKQYFEYQKYKKTELKHNKMLQEELTKLNVSESQMKEAKNLQRKIFNTFERVDDKSQEYSESMEAAVQIAQPFVYSAGLIVMVSPVLYTGYLVAKGKLSAKSVINKVLTTLSGTSKITEKKWFKNYLNNIAKQLPDKVAETTANTEILGKVFADINLEKTPVVEIISKFTKNSAKYIKNFSKLSTDEKKKVIEDIVRLLPENNEIVKRLDSLKYAPDNIFDAVMNAIHKPSELGKSIQKMEDYEYLRFGAAIKDLLGGARNKLDYKTENIGFFDALFSMPQQKLGQFLDSLLSKESVKKLAGMTNEEFARHKNNILLPLIDSCERHISKFKNASASESEALSGLLRNDETTSYLILKRIFGTIYEIPKEDVGLIDKILTQKKDFIKNISDADFEFIKRRINEKLELSDDFLSGLTRENLQSYVQEITAFIEKAKTNPNINDEALVPIFRKVLFGISGDKQFLNMSKADFYKFLDTEFLSSLTEKVNSSESNKILNSQIEKLKNVLAHPEKPLPNLKNIKLGDLIPEINPIKEIEKIETKIKAKTDEDFTKFMLRLENRQRLFARFKVSDMDKAYVLDCLDKLKKVVVKLPKGEMQNVMSSMINAFSERPDQFVAYVQSGKIINFYKTDGFKKAVIAAGVSWTAINVAMTYTIESILADLQIKAGRLGVMKALDSLEDPSYYANIEPETTPAPVLVTQSAIMPNNLLDIMKK